MSHPYDQSYFEHGDPSVPGYHDYHTCRGVVRDLAGLITKHVFPCGTAADLGCAYGYVVEFLREEGYDALGYDISEWALSRAPEHVRPYLILHDLGKPLPIGPSTVSLVICVETLEHVAEDASLRLLEEIDRVTAEAAVLLIAFGQGSYDHTQQDPTHINMHTRRWWVEAIGAHCPRLFIDEVTVHLIEAESKCLDGWKGRFFVLRRRLDP